MAQREATVHGLLAQVGLVGQRDAVEFLVIADMIEMQVGGEHGHWHLGERLDDLAVL